MSDPKDSQLTMTEQEFGERYCGSPFALGAFVESMPFGTGGGTVFGHENSVPFLGAWVKTVEWAIKDCLANQDNESFRSCLGQLSLFHAILRGFTYSVACDQSDNALANKLYRHADLVLQLCSVLRDGLPLLHGYVGKTPVWFSDVDHPADTITTDQLVELLHDRLARAQADQKRLQ